MKILEVSNNNLKEHDSDDTFAQRAESYYQKQPKLLSLLNDLYNAYISLSDRYLHALTNSKNGSDKQQSSQDSMEDIDSDIESCLSYQRLSSMAQNCFPVDDLVVEFVMKSAEYDLMLHELGIMEQCRGESSCKIGIQSSLLEVMEAERSFLLSQNKSLGHKLAVLEEENEELLLESNLIRNKATELARCVLEMKEEESVGRLLRTIEALQDRVHELEEMNMEYCKVIIGSGGEEGLFGGCFQMEKWKKKWKVKVKVKVSRKGKKERKGKKRVIASGDVGGRWWRKVKNLGIFKRVGRRL